MDIVDRLNYGSQCPVSSPGGDLSKDMQDAAEEIMRLRARKYALREALKEIDNLIDGEVDVRDGDEGRQLPNTAMSVRMVIDRVLPEPPHQTCHSDADAIPTPRANALIEEWGDPDPEDSPRYTAALTAVVEVERAMADVELRIAVLERERDRRIAELQSELAQANPQNSQYSSEAK